METWFEILIPLGVIVGIPFFKKIFLEKDESSPERSFTESYEETAADQQCPIQEEIRRKIEARRQPANEWQKEVTPTVAPVAPPPVAEIPSSRRSVVKKNLEKRQLEQEDSPESIHEIPPYVMPTHETKTDPPGSFSWDISDNVYEQTITTQLKQIEETKRQATFLREQAQVVRKKINGDAYRSYIGGSVRSGSVRENLRNPVVARSAFIYGEVLGPPVSLHKDRT